MNGKPLPGHLPRLQPEFYQGDAAVHWTLTVFDRSSGWLSDAFHQKFRELMLHVSAKFPSPLNGERDQGRGVRTQINA